MINTESSGKATQDFTSEATASERDDLLESVSGETDACPFLQIACFLFSFKTTVTPALTTKCLYARSGAHGESEKLFSSDTTPAQPTDTSSPQRPAGQQGQLFHKTWADGDSAKPGPILACAKLSTPCPLEQSQGEPLYPFSSFPTAQTKSPLEQLLTQSSLH